MQAKGATLLQGCRWDLMKMELLELVVTPKTLHQPPQLEIACEVRSANKMAMH